nr:alcohol dehydrogenase 3, mitochondrial [Quercus suber]
MNKKVVTTEPSLGLLWVTSTLKKPDETTTDAFGAWSWQEGTRARRPSQFQWTTCISTAARVEVEVNPESEHDRSKGEAGEEYMNAGRWDHRLKKIITRKTPKPKPGPNQILIKIEKAALCHSDLGSVDEHYPATLGHEGAGRVEELHPSVANKFFQTGDRVGYLSTFGSCGECMECLIHDSSCAVGRRTAHGFTFHNLFSEFAVVDYCDCSHIPESFDSDSIVAPIFCAGITSFHSVGSANLDRDDWFAIVGTGGLGPIAAHIAKAMHLRVVVMDSNDAMLEVCKTWGADAVVTSRGNRDYVADLKKVTHGGVKAACIYNTADAIMMAVDLPHNAVRTSSIDLALGKLHNGRDRKILERVKGAIGMNSRAGKIPDVPVQRLDELGAKVNATRAWACERNESVSSDRSVKFGGVTYIED